MKCHHVNFLQALLLLQGCHYTRYVLVEEEWKEKGSCHSCSVMYEKLDGVKVDFI